MVGRVYKCTRTLYSLGWVEDKEAARGRPADWSETSAGGERIERHSKKLNGGLFAFWPASGKTKQVATALHRWEPILS